MKTDIMYRVLVGTVFVLLITLVLYVGTNLVKKENKTIEEAKNNEVVVDNKDVSIYNEQVGEENKEEAKFIKCHGMPPYSAPRNALWASE